MTLTVTADASGAGVTVRWAPHATATSYQVGVVPPPPVGPATVTVAAPPLEAAFSPLTNGVTYAFTVTALAATVPVDTGTAHATPVAARSAGVAPTPLLLVVIPAAAALTVSYAPVPGAASYRISVDPAPSTGSSTRERAATDPSSVTFSDLADDVSHTVSAEALDAGGTVLAAGSATATPTTGVSSIPISFDLSRVSSPFVAHEADVAGLLRSATATAARWRYDLLRQQACSAAQAAATFETQIAALMALDLDKVAAGEELVGSFAHELLGVLNELGGKLGTVAEGAGRSVAAPAAAVADAVAQQVLLSRLLAWLTQTSVVGLWIGIFDRLIDDIAAFDTGLARTRAYLGEQFGASGIGDTVLSVLGDLRGTLDETVEKMSGPVREAVAQTLDEAAATAMKVLDAFDEPLLGDALSGAAAEAGTSVPGMDRLAAEINEAVDQIVAEIKDSLDAALSDLTGADAAQRLFVSVVVTYLVLPILAVLVVAVAGGPVSAAVLAASVTVGAQELVHLLARLLGGPLTRVLDDAAQAVAAAVTALEGAVGGVFELVGDLESPEFTTGPFVAAQLANLSGLAPREWLDEAAALLGGARDASVRVATDLALAAEQALGMENGTVFDVVGTEYRGAAATARLPGGEQPNQWAAAALLADLQRLDRARVELLDTKELRVTERLSLVALLGGAGEAALRRLLEGEEIAIRLSEALLLDDRHPGLYRALVDDVRLIGIVPEPAALGPQTSVPVHLTHSGESRTRIKLGTNPRIAPGRVAPRWRQTGRSFALRLWSDELLTDIVGTYVMWLLAMQWHASVHHVRHQPPPAAPDLAGMIRDRVAELEPALLDTEEVNDLLPALMGLLQLAQDNATSPAPGWVLLRAAAEVSASPWANLMRTGRLPDGTRVATGLLDVAVRAHGAARARRAGHDGKWGGAWLEEDRDEAIASLGFASLVRSQDAEVAVFSLVPDVSLGTTAGALQSATAPPAAMSSGSSGQYRPFENRGLDSTFTLRLPGARGADAVAAPRLSDLVMEVTYRACHDVDLAAAVRASRREADDQLAVARATGLQDHELVAVPALVRERTSERRSFHISLRGHRDRTLRLWQAALAAHRGVHGSLPAAGADWSSVEQLEQLRAGDAYLPLPLPGGGERLDISFSRAPVGSGLPGDGGALAALASAVVLTPATLGVADSATSGLGGADSALVAISLSVVPMPTGTRRRGRVFDQRPRVAAPDASPSLHLWSQPRFGWADPLDRVRVTCAGPSSALLPQFAAPSNPGRLALSPFEPGDEPRVDLPSVFSFGGPAVTVDLGGTAKDRLVYDVIVGFTFTKGLDELVLSPS